MKKLLYQLDTDRHPSVFDNVLAHDGGADQVAAYGEVRPDHVRALVEGAIFTRAPRDKHRTALFVGGSDLAAGEALLAAVRQCFFANFRVSVMLDSNGANTTAAAAVAWLERLALQRAGVAPGSAAAAEQGAILRGKRAVVLAGTGPVGQRAAVLLAREGAQVTLVGRDMARTQAAAARVGERAGAEVGALAATDAKARAQAIESAQLVLATGAAATPLLAEAAWAGAGALELLCDASPTPPAGIEGVDPMDKGTLRHGKACLGALGFGATKLALHRACIGLLFERPDLLLDAEQIHAHARALVLGALP
jgi:hypothetical protein